MDHVVRLENNKMTKAMVSGCYEGLEGKEKKMGCNKKILLCWIKILNEFGVDWTDVNRVCCDRDNWKMC